MCYHKFRTIISGKILLELKVEKTLTYVGLGLIDPFLQFQDVLKLTEALPNLVANYLVPYANWNHLDYLWGIDADTLLYPEVLKNMEKFRKDMP